jgi:hypothetical protein
LIPTSPIHGTRTPSNNSARVQTSHRLWHACPCTLLLWQQLVEVVEFTLLVVGTLLDQKPQTVTLLVPMVTLLVVEVTPLLSAQPTARLLVLHQPVVVLHPTTGSLQLQ